MGNKILNLAGIDLDLSVPKVMGVVNFDKNSFYTGSRVGNINDLNKKIDQMVEDGVDILDLGATSSRPGSNISDPEKEIEILLPYIKIIRSRYPKLILSVDTYHSKVVRVCIQEGINLINDISAGEIDSSIFNEIIKEKVGYVLMHMRGLPNNMQQNVEYDNLLVEITNFFSNKLEYLEERGVENIIIDPGIGFGKSLESNYKIIKKMNYFNNFDCPLLVGISRKSLIQKLLKVGPDNALNGTTALHMLCLNNGANILRAHDVKEAKEAIKIWRYYVSI
mgnify:CR=1 FL=1